MPQSGTFTCHCDLPAVSPKVLECAATTAVCPRAATPEPDENGSLGEAALHLPGTDHVRAAVPSGGGSFSCTAPSPVSLSHPHGPPRPLRSVEGWLGDGEAQGNRGPKMPSKATNI